MSFRFAILENMAARVIIHTQNYLCCLVICLMPLVADLWPCTFRNFWPGWAGTRRTYPRWITSFVSPLCPPSLPVLTLPNCLQFGSPLYHLSMNLHPFIVSHPHHIRLLFLSGSTGCFLATNTLRQLHVLFTGGIKICLHLCNTILPIFLFVIL